jgi:hypothetical protein
MICDKFFFTRILSQICDNFYTNQFLSHAAVYATGLFMVVYNTFTNPYCGWPGTPKPFFQLFIQANKTF